MPKPKLDLAHLPDDLILIIVNDLVLDLENDDPEQDPPPSSSRYPQDLLNLRATCSRLCHIASPRAFHILTFTHTLRSINGFLAMLQSPWVREGVKVVNYQYWDPEPQRYDEITPDELAARASRSEIRKLLHHTLSRLYELPALNALSIRFGEVVPVKGNLAIMDDLSSILDALLVLGASLSRPLESLSITRLPPFHCAQYEDVAFGALMRDLTRLELHTGSANAWLRRSDEPNANKEIPSGVPVEPFLCDTLWRRLVMLPNPATLTALSLGFSDFFGAHPFPFPFAQLRFPRLRALRLQHVQFSDSGDAEALILRHSETLMELHLWHCQIVVPRDVPEQNGNALGAQDEAFDDEFGDDDSPEVSRPWSRIYAKLSEELQRLVFLSIQDAWWVQPENYASYNQDYLSPFLDHDRGEDMQALEGFQSVVAHRVKAQRAEYRPTFKVPDEYDLICEC
ncbi:hypothetical protein BC834DRAFT_910783 [Gloeopeniophorella convolvens]|nr:hypothetical protein BC834DRAFT_910783 [Gloeopeniophorella convolvens]